MKYDLTKFAAFVRSAMEEARKMDKNYTWTIRAINKNSIKFNWSYLGKDEYFTLTVNDRIDDEIYVKVKMPCGVSSIVLLIGEEFYHDAKSIEMGIYHGIIRTADKAMRLF